MGSSDVTPACRPEPRAAFDVAMRALDQRLQRLATSIQVRDVEDVANIARNAVYVWLAGRAALRRLVEKADGEIPCHLRVARGQLEASREALLEVLALTATTLAVEQLDRSIAELRAILDSASVLEADAAPPRTG